MIIIFEMIFGNFQVDSEIDIEIENDIIIEMVRWFLSTATAHRPNDCMIDNGKDWNIFDEFFNWNIHKLPVD